jgi:hypothetical protein
MARHKAQLRQELTLATDDQLREEGKRLHSMHQYKARMVFDEARSPPSPSVSGFQDPNVRRKRT